MTDVLLINPYFTQRLNFYTFYKPSLPLGLMYIAAYLRQHNVYPKIIELGIFSLDEAIVKGDKIRFGISDQKLVSILKKEKPKIIGITSMYSVYYRDVLNIAKIIKKYDSKIKIIIGGNHPSSYWDSILKNHEIDYIVVGEGETTFLKLTKYLLANNKMSSINIKGVAYRHNQKIVYSGPAPLISDLDKIPFPARDLIDFQQYLPKASDTPYVMRYPVASIITSRGCPGNCVYCTVKAVWGRTWRGRSPKNVVDEIELLIQQYGIKEFAFLDDSASVNKNRWIGICDEIIHRKLDIKWSTPNGIAHWTLDKPTLKKMYEAGCYRITFGIESGNQRTREFLGKPYSLKQAQELIKYANKIGMWTICTNIIGFPYEQLNSVTDTIEFAKSCGTDFATFYLLIPQPTSEVYSYFRKENLLNLDRFLISINDDDEETEKVNSVLNEGGTNTKYFTKDQLKELQRKAYRQFLIHRALSYASNPLLILRKIKNKEELFYVTKLLRIGLLIIIRTLNPFNVKSGDFLYRKHKFTKSA